MYLQCAAYWGSRAESVESCAERVGTFLDGLEQNCGERLGSWFPQGRRSKAGPVGRDQESLVKLLVAGQNRREADGEVLAELGFHVGWWNRGRGKAAASLSLTCGVRSDTASNVALIVLPEDFVEVEGRTGALEIVRTLARAWDPDWAGVFSTEAMNSRDFDARVPFADWILYLASHRVPENALAEESVDVENLSTGGVLLTLGDRPVEPKEKNHRRRVSKVESWLR